MTDTEREAAASLEAVDIDVLMFLGPEVLAEVPELALPMVVPLVSRIERIQTH